ncbi:MAG TPA: hypothetical protein VLQ91_19000 [Draconibacterium sp.]|nr:hypothetical protein [Draconibacterium sp.]
MVKRFKLKYFISALLVAVIVITSVDLLRISNYEIIPMKPDVNIDCQQDQVYFELVNDTGDMDWNRLDGTLEYIQNEYDCADFRLVNLVRILYEYGDKIPADYKEKIENVLFSFRYWWDEPGENSMCYWSENHQILFASAEYLIGQKYPKTVFPNSGLTGKQHMEKARERILDWLEMRWKYGFIEYYSGVYYKEDIGAMINLIDFAGDDEIVKKTEIIFDLLFYDVATQNTGNMFVSVSGRAYEANRKGGPGSTLGGLTHYFWGDGKQIGPGLMYGMMTTKKYELPAVLSEIALDSSNSVIRQNNGLDISELKTEGYFGTDNRSMMMQWGMEAFTNPEVVRNSLTHIRNCNMFSNEFIGDFKMLDFTLLRLFQLEPLLIRLVNPQSNGVAIQKANTYTFKTKNYSLYSVQNHYPGDYADQQHVNGMNIGNSFSIFHTHPALEAGKKNQSPNYWVGYGHFPHVAQDSNISLAIYNIPKKKGIMEIALPDYTHAYFPSELFDTVVINQNYAFGKKGETYAAFITKNPLEFRENTTDDLIQQGKQTFWITEAGSLEEDGSFEEFCKRIISNEMTFDAENLILNYRSKDKNLQLKFEGDFLVDGKTVDTNYDRFDSPYSRTKKKADTIEITFNGKSLFLDFYNMKRIIDNE